MPELPEVETTRRGIEPHLRGACVRAVQLRDARLRWPVPAGLPEHLQGRRLAELTRRGKYLLLRFDGGGKETGKEAADKGGTLLLHLGMSGSLRLVSLGTPPRPHDHLDLLFDNGQVLRLHDPRRFGAALWLVGDPGEHALLAHLGPEPLSADFDAAYLHARTRGRALPIKSFLMDSRQVVGVGNIYANEALFLAGIRPRRAASRLSRADCERLAASVKDTLARAIEAGGTTLRDFVGGDGKPGYFSQSLHVYGRGGEPCGRCGGPLTEIRLGGRSTVYCPRCQR